MEGASAFSGQHADTWRPPVVSASHEWWGLCSGRHYFPPYSWDQLWIILKTKKQNLKSKKSRSKSDEEETGLELENERRIVLTPLKGHSRASSVSSNATDDLSRQGTTGKIRKYESEEDNAKADDIEGGGCLTTVTEERNELEKFLF